MPYLIAGGAVLLLLVWTIGNYNGLVRMRAHCDESWSDIDSELKRRHDLVPRLVETVRGYARHEERVFESVAQARQTAIDSQVSVKDLSRNESDLVRRMGGLFALVEQYPDIKADEQFAALQRELVETEDRIQSSRRIFNANVRDLNTRVESFPVSLIAAALGFKQREFFEVDRLDERINPDFIL